MGWGSGEKNAVISFPPLQIDLTTPPLFILPDPFEKIDTFFGNYHGLAKERPWVEHLTNLSKKGDALLSVSSAKYNAQFSYSQMSIALDAVHRYTP